MEETTKKWLTGCGIGCLVVLIAGVLVIAGGYLGVKKMIQKAKETQVVMEAVTEEFGRVSDFTPAESGVVAPERVEAFLKVRILSLEERIRLEATLEQLSTAEENGEGSSNMDFARSVRAGIGIVPQMMAYVTRRNQAFLDAGMGLGEYLYLYTLIYQSWLGKPVDDGPPFVLVGGEVRPNDWSSPDVRQQRGDEIRRRLNRTVLPMLRNQLESLANARTPVNDAWAESLRTEILLLEEDPLRLPWQDGLPEHTAASLQPYWEPLEASYSTLCHPVEFAVRQD